MVDTIGEVLVKEGVFTVSKVCIETSGEKIVRVDVSTDF